MFFLLRMAFWFSLVLLALPFDLGAPEDGAPRVGPLQALSAARDAVGDLAGLCQRKPDVCETGRSAIQTIGVRAKEGSRFALEMLDDQAEEPAGADQPAVIAGSIPAKD